MFIEADRKDGLFRQSELGNYLRLDQPLEILFLSRLRRLLRLREAYIGDSIEGRFIKNALAGTYRDCAFLGVGKQALDLYKKSNRNSSLL